MWRMVEEKKEMERLMKETVDEWQEMEDKEKVVWVVDIGMCESEGVQRWVESVHIHMYVYVEGI